MRDRTRYGGNYLNIKDDKCPPYSPFYVFISGNIESGQISDYDGICCKYDFVAGTDWSIIDVSLYTKAQLQMYRVTEVECLSIAIRAS